MSSYNFFVIVNQSLPSFSFNREGFVVVFVMWIRSGDICDQSPKLSKINYVKFWTFLPSQIFAGSYSSKLVSTLSPLPRATSHGKLSPISPKVIGTLMQCCDLETKLS